MADKPINLNQFRKRRAKDEARKTADRNAAFHGLTLAEKRRARAEAERQERVQDAHRLERPESET